jgi:hypothetical protein
VAPGLDRPPVTGVQRLDRVRGADDGPDLDVVVQERDELLPRVLPQPDDRPVPLASFLRQLVQRGPGRGGVHRGVDRLHVTLEGVPVPLGREPEGVADQVWPPRINMLDFLGQAALVVCWWRRGGRRPRRSGGLWG